MAVTVVMIVVMFICLGCFDCYDWFLIRFGAGSEFGREAKEEARRKKLGIVARKYKPEDQPWILKCYGSSVKKFKGV